MAAFNKSDENRLDWSLLRGSSVTMFFREHTLTNTVQWLADQGYTMIDVNCSVAGNSAELLKAIGRKWVFPEYFSGENIDTFDDILYGIQIPSRAGVAIILRRFDLIAKSERRRAWQILNILDNHSRLQMMGGSMLLTLVQTAHPRISFVQIGAQNVKWNDEETFNSQTG